jgi:hypothetical protein
MQTCQLECVLFLHDHSNCIPYCCCCCHHRGMLGSARLPAKHGSTATADTMPSLLLLPPGESVDVTIRFEPPYASQEGTQSGAGTGRSRRSIAGQRSSVSGGGAPPSARGQAQAAACLPEASTTAQYEGALRVTFSTGQQQVSWIVSRKSIWIVSRKESVCQPMYRTAADPHAKHALHRYLHLHQHGKRLMFIFADSALPCGVCRSCHCRLLWSSLSCLCHVPRVPWTLGQCTQQPPAHWSLSSQTQRELRQHGRRPYSHWRHELQQKLASSLGSLCSKLLHQRSRCCRTRVCWLGGAWACPSRRGCRWCLCRSAVVCLGLSYGWVCVGAGQCLWCSWVKGFMLRGQSCVLHMTCEPVPLCGTLRCIRACNRKGVE